MRVLENQTGVEAPSGDYPKGRIVDAQTVVGEGVNGDMVQFFQRMAELAGVTENDLPDNITNGYQLIQALDDYLKLTGKVDISLNADWTDGTGLGVYYWIDKMGYVHLEGEVDGDVNASSLICTLPAVVRPARAKSFVVFCYESGGSNQNYPMPLQVDTDGNVYSYRLDPSKVNKVKLSPIVYHLTL